MKRAAHSSRSAHHTVGRRILWLGATLLALEVVYLVAGNLFLHFGLLPLVDRRPQTIFMAYESAYTIWPGVAHISRFRLRGQSGSIQWRLEVEAADVTVDLGALFDKKFHATHTRASSVAFRLRRKLDDDHAAAPRAAALAPIDGFDDPPLKPIGPPKPPVADGDDEEWRVAMEDVDASVREVWIDEWRCLGNAEVTGGFFINPERLVQIGPNTIDVREGEFQIGGRPALTQIDAHIEAVVGVIDLRVPSDDAVRAISARGRVDGRVPSLDFLKLYLPSDQSLRVEDGAGALHADVNLVNGRIMPATRIEVESEHLVLGANAFGATVAFVAEARVEAAASGPIASGDIRVVSGTISREGTRAASPRIENGRAHFTGLPHDLVGPFEIEHTDLDVPVRLPDLHWLVSTPIGAIGKRPALDLAGTATLHARVALDRDGTAAGRVEGHSEHVALTTATFGASAHLAAHVAFNDAHLETKSVVLAPSSVVATDLSIARDGRDYKGGRVRVDVTEGRLEDGVPHYLALTIAARLRDIGWLAFHDGTDSKRHVEARAGDVRASFLVRRPAALFDEGSTEAGVTGSIAAALSADGRVDDVAMRGHLTVSALIDGLEPERRTIHLAAIHAALEDVEIDRGTHRTSGWWGRFAARRFDVSAASRVRVSAHVDAHCKDGAPFLAVLTGAGTIPGWVGDIFPMNGLTASGDLKSREVVDLKLDVKGSSADVTARLHDVGGKMDGAVLVRAGVLSVGVGLTAGQSHVTFFAGEEWLNARIDALKQAEDLRRAAPIVEAVSGLGASARR